MTDPDVLRVEKVAVLGAGVMGAQIAAHLVNAGVETVLFDLASPEGDGNAIARKGIDGLGKLEPAPLARKTLAAHIQASNYDQHLKRLAGCDLVIEAIAERMDLKKALYERVAPLIDDSAVFVTNTSGLSIASLSAALPAKLRGRFCGVHFFNPPRYMHLVELIPGPQTQERLLDQLEAFLTTTLGKGVIRALDTPNFIANRVGVFSILAAFYHTERFGLGFDEVDALTGSLIGRPKSATYRTADVVGLDTLAHVINTMKDTLPDDPWHRYYDVPQWLATLIEQGALGQKSRKGVYQKVGKEIRVLQRASGDYAAPGRVADEAVVAMLKNPDPGERFAQLRASGLPQAQFMWAVFRDMLHYCACHLQEIAANARDLDLAIRWGFGWKQGPFEIWQAAGWPQVATWISEDIAAGKTMASEPLPAWATDVTRTGVHTKEGSYSPGFDRYQGRSRLPVYRRQAFPDRLISEPATFGTTVFETDAVRVWSSGDDIAVISFKSKMHTVGGDVLDGLARAIDEAEQGFRGLVIWQTEPPFSIGANLQGGGGKGGSKPSALQSAFRRFRRSAEAAVLQAARRLNVADALMAGRLEKIEQTVEQFQQTNLALRYAMVPTVAAVDGMALGGGCEIAMHCDKVVASLESYVGLVEVGVGLIPGAGGSKELALRAAAEAKGGDLFPFLRRYFENVATAQVGRSAEQSRDLGYLRNSDHVVMNRFELLYVAKQHLIALDESGYRPPLRAIQIPVAGRGAIATLKMGMQNMLAGNYISEHDYLIGSKLAYVMCGGDIETGTLVDEQWFLDLEREAFIELLATEKTQARVEHMLKTGKPLRN